MVNVGDDEKGVCNKKQDVVIGHNANGEVSRGCLNGFTLHVESPRAHKQTFPHVNHQIDNSEHDNTCKDEKDTTEYYVELPFIIVGNVEMVDDGFIHF